MSRRLYGARTIRTRLQGHWQPEGLNKPGNTERDKALATNKGSQERTFILNAFIVTEQSCYDKGKSNFAQCIMADPQHPQKCLQAGWFLCV